MRGPPKHGSVYFVRRLDGEGPIKIGISCVPYRRLDTLNGASPYELTIIALIEGSAELERRFHNHFKYAHIRREWFLAVPAVLAAVETINAGTFDLASLPEPFNLIESLRPPREPWTEEQRESHRKRARKRAADRRERTDRKPLRTYRRRDREQIKRIDPRLEI